MYVRHAKKGRSTGGASLLRRDTRADPSSPRPNACRLLACPCLYLFLSPFLFLVCFSRAGTTNATRQADVWSAGVILFTMLAGHPPMEKANSKDWWFRALKVRVGVCGLLGVARISAF